MSVPWFELHAGKGCPLCAPRPPKSEHSYFVCNLAISSLYLTRNQAYRGSCTLIYDRAHVTRPSELDLGAWRQLCSDVWLAESAMTRVFRPDHVNVEFLGNAVPHLHAWIVPRYRSDPRWGGPIWMTSVQELVRVPATDDECEALAQALRDNIQRAA